MDHASLASSSPDRADLSSDEVNVSEWVPSPDGWASPLQRDQRDQILTPTSQKLPKMSQVSSIMWREPMKSRIIWWISPTRQQEQEEIHPKIQSNARGTRPTNLMMMFPPKNNCQKSVFGWQIQPQISKIRNRACHTKYTSVSY